MGYCSECKERHWVRKCKECENYCCEIESNQYSLNNVYFCSDECLEIYKDSWNLYVVAETLLHLLIIFTPPSTHVVCIDDT